MPRAPSALQRGHGEGTPLGRGHGPLPLPTTPGAGTWTGTPGASPTPALPQYPCPSHRSEDRAPQRPPGPPEPASTGPPGAGSEGRTGGGREPGRLPGRAGGGMGGGLPGPRSRPCCQPSEAGCYFFISGDKGPFMSAARWAVTWEPHRLQTEWALPGRPRGACPGAAGSAAGRGGRCPASRRLPGTRCPGAAGGAVSPAQGRRGPSKRQTPRVPAVRPSPQPPRQPGQRSGACARPAHRGPGQRRWH